MRDTADGTGNPFGYLLDGKPQLRTRQQGDHSDIGDRGHRCDCWFEMQLGRSKHLELALQLDCHFEAQRVNEEVGDRCGLLGDPGVVDAGLVKHILGGPIGAFDHRCEARRHSLEQLVVARKHLSGASLQRL